MSFLSFSPKIDISFSFIDYCRYLFAKDLPPGFVRFRTGSGNLETKYLTELKERYAIKNAWQVASFVWNAFFKFYVSLIILAYFKKHRKDWRTTGIIYGTFPSLRSILDCYLLGYALGFTMEAMLGTGMRLIAFALNSSYIPMMDSPYFSSGIREFWRSWNPIFGSFLQCTVYFPLLRVLDQFKLSKKSKVGLAALMVFLFSGVMHEWTLTGLMRIPVFGYQFCFFMIHGAASCIETYLKQYLTVGKSFGLVYTHLLLGLTSVLFFEPYLHEQLHLSLPWIPDL
jgi:D-alanyl-lipoteichoic acid acyltransferase DltB (MBOAT superfamily)